MNGNLVIDYAALAPCNLPMLPVGLLRRYAYAIDDGFVSLVVPERFGFNGAAFLDYLQPDEVFVSNIEPLDSFSQRGEVRMGVLRFGNHWVQFRLWLEEENCSYCGKPAWRSDDRYCDIWFNRAIRAANGAAASVIFRAINLSRGMKVIRQLDSEHDVATNPAYREMLNRDEWELAITRSLLRRRN